MDEETDCTVGSGNVFADRGLPEPETRLAKAELARQLGMIIRDHGWTQAAAAQKLGVDQSTVSKLLRGRLAGFSVERLMDWLTRLDRDVTIAVTPKEPAAPRARIVVNSRSLPATGSGRRGNER